MLVIIMREQRVVGVVGWRLPAAGSACRAQRHLGHVWGMNQGTPRASLGLHPPSMSMAAVYALASRPRVRAPFRTPSCHPRARWEGQSRYRADNHGQWHVGDDLWSPNALAA